LHSDGIDQSFLIGWASHEDLLKAKKGNKDSSPDCAWKEMAFYIPIESLRPMSELLELCKIKEIPQGILFEKLPADGDLPILANKAIQTMMSSKSEDDFDFLASVGIKGADQTPVKSIVETVATQARKDDGFGL
jgi:hypothetical protein